MKALFINSKESTVERIDLDTSGENGYKAISQRIGCEYFTAIKLKAHKDGTCETIYCDDEGMVNGTDHGVIHANYGPIFGNVLIVGTDGKGESIDTKLEPSELLNESIVLSFRLKGDDASDLAMRVITEKEAK